MPAGPLGGAAGGEAATLPQRAGRPLRLPIIAAMNPRTSRLLRFFVTGLLAALPLAATVAIFWWGVHLLLRWVGPNSPVGSVLGAIGFGITGSEVVGYVIGIVLIVGFIVLLGAWVEAGLQRGAAKLLDTMLRRIPLVRTVYDLSHRMVGLFRQRDADGVRAMSPVWLHFGGPGGAAVLGLLSSPQAVDVAGQRCLAVLVPTAPVPVGGGLLYVPEHWVTPAPLGVEALTSLYVSMGVTSAQHLPKAPGLPSPPVAAVPQPAAVAPPDNRAA